MKKGNSLGEDESDADSTESESQEGLGGKKSVGGSNASAPGAASAVDGWDMEGYGGVGVDEEEERTAHISSSFSDGVVRGEEGKGLRGLPVEKRDFVLLGSIAQTLTVSPDLETLLADPQVGVTSYSTQTLLKEYDELVPGEGSEKCGGKGKRSKSKAGGNA